ncbi:MAG: TRAM domain-containing protein [Kiritimatiellae bacterium]|nr:TRAM domain-containing protein [Kiritimatiellia bacterium]
MSGQNVELEGARWRAIALLAIVMLGIALVVAVFFAVRKPSAARITTQLGEGAALVNTGAVLDATDPSVRLTPQVGYRYRVFVDDESDDRASGVTRIGGKTTFIDGARRGQTCIVDVTRVQERVVNASLVRVVSEVTLAPKPKREPYVPAADDPAAFVKDGAVLDVVISEASSKNPETEGVAKVEGLIVFVTGATTMGERVNVRITQRRERMAFAELTGEPAGTGPLPYSESGSRRSRSAFVPTANDETAFVVPGAEFDVIISEASSKNPDTEGVARVRGLVIFVEGATTIGERVNVRVTERRERMAQAVLSGKSAGTAPLPYAAPAARPRRSPSYIPPPGDETAFVVPGAEFDVVISEASSKNPLTEGIARVRGLVIFVEGATTIGERVNIRITDRRERMAFAALSGHPAGTGPLPYAMPQMNAQPQVRLDTPAPAADTTAPATKPAAKSAAPAAKPVAPAAKPAAPASKPAAPATKPAAPATKPAAEPAAKSPAADAPAVAQIVPGAEFDVVIEQKSSKNPGLEGIAKINGFVIIVKGAPTVGQHARIRISDRKTRVAFADVIAPAAP